MILETVVILNSTPNSIPSNYAQLVFSVIYLCFETLIIFFNQKLKCDMTMPRLLRNNIYHFLAKTLWSCLQIQEVRVIMKTVFMFCVSILMFHLWLQSCGGIVTPGCSLACSVAASVAKGSFLSTQYWEGTSSTSQATTSQPAVGSLEIWAPFTAILILK